MILLSYAPIYKQHLLFHEPNVSQATCNRPILLHYSIPEWQLMLLLLVVSGCNNLHDGPLSENSSFALFSVFLKPTRGFGLVFFFCSVFSSPRQRLNVQ